MKHLLLSFLAITAFLLSCSDDEETLPAYVQNLAVLSSDHSGTASAIAFDNGEEYTLTQAISGLRPDSTYRIQALYLHQDGKVALSKYAWVLAPSAVHYDASRIVADPLTVYACWKAGNYINLRLGVKTLAEGVHYLGFHAADTLRYADGKQTVEIQMLHSQNNNPLYYTGETYLSLPLRPFDAVLQAGRDSIRLSVETFGGTKRYTFPF